MSLFLSILLKMITDTFAGVVNEQLDRSRDARTNRELGAAEQAATSHREADRQETEARSGDRAAEEGEDDPRDLRD